VVLATALLLVLAPPWFGPPPGPRFRDVAELRAWAEARGLYWRSDRPDNKVTFGLVVSTRPVGWEEANSIALFRPGKGRREVPEGTLWAVNCAPSLRLPPGAGDWRVWGDVVVTGDPPFLDRIERGELPERP
jgi:hypothetical protein